MILLIQTDTIKETETNDSYLFMWIFPDKSAIQRIYQSEIKQTILILSSWVNAKDVQLFVSIPLHLAYKRCHRFSIKILIEQPALLIELPHARIILDRNRAITDRGESLHKMHAPLEIDDLTLRLSRASRRLASRCNEPPCEMSTTSSNKSDPHQRAADEVVPEKFHRKLSSLYRRHCHSLGSSRRHRRCSNI